MAFYYVYAPSDFIGGLPFESRGAASGGAPFNLTLAPGATPVLVEVIDDDPVFNEIGDLQTIASPVTIGGTTYPAGTTVNAAYDLINTGTSHKVTSLHFGGNGYEQGAVDGLISTVPLTPGVTYTFNFERSSYLSGNAYDEFIACFTTGTQIATQDGVQTIETLSPGDLIQTMDSGFQTLRWIGTRSVSAEGNFAPVRFEAGAIGNETVLEVSPEHRMLISGAQVELLFGERDVLVPAKSLVNGRSVTRRTGGQVTYVHLLFDAHEVVFANGIPSEALLLSEASMRGFPDASMAEALELFPLAAQEMRAARRCLKAREARLLAA